MSTPESFGRTGPLSMRRWFQQGACLVMVLTALLQEKARADATNAFQLLDGDRVALIGDTFIEREQTYGYIEYILTTHFPERNVIFRNLGWSGDTPAGLSRLGFDIDSPKKGLERIREEMSAFKPTVVFVGYGMASSFEGEAGLDQFNREMKQLLDAIEGIGGKGKVRFVLLGPLPHEKLPRPLPDPSQHKQQLILYSKAIEMIAQERGSRFISLLSQLGFEGAAAGPTLTDDGIHLTAFGYRNAGEAIGRGLGWEPHAWRAGILPDGKLRPGSYGAQVVEHEKRDDYAKFVIQPNQIVLPPPYSDETRGPSRTPVNRLQVQGLKAGEYELRVDGKTIRSVTEKEALASIVMEEGPQYEQAEELRDAIRRKNELFFHRWRPQNNTYLFLFRKHEQGQNAKEIPQFDPLVKAEEEKIARLRKPKKHTIEFVAAAAPFAPFTKEPKSAKAKRRTPPVTEHPATPFRPQPVPVFQTDPNIEIKLWAENPLLAKPIQMNFDSQGRLWVASSSVYPQIAPGQEADDKILILEDTDQDGKADKTTVFTEGLLIPSAVIAGDGGAYVGQSTELLHFKDTDGDGIADQKRIVLSGFGTEDTHHTLHTLHWGYDGQLYMNQSIYIHSHLETPHGVVRLNSGGILSLRPGTMELDILMKGLVNGWGHQYDKYGQSFATDGAGGNGINYVVPGAMYVTYAGARRILGSVSPGSYPKFCSLEIIYSQQFPDDWQGQMVTCDFRANRVVRFSIDEQGSAYVTREMPLFIRTTNVTFRPIDVKIGPDGALYLADWSNPIIQHGEVDFRDPRRDRVHGRIWRVSYKGRPLLPKPQLANATEPALLDHLLSPNGFNRQQARRVLTEHGEKIIPALQLWLKNHESEQAALEALWMYEALNKPEQALLNRLLEAKDYHIRAAATRIVANWRKRVDNPIDLLAARIVDEHPRVRMEAARALARIPTARAAELVLSALDKPIDTHLEYAIWLSINDLAQPWIAAVESGAWKPEGRQKQLEYALKAIEPASASQLLAKVMKNIPHDGAGTMIELIGQAAGPAQLRQLYDQVLQNGFDEAATARALIALAEAARLRNARPTGELNGVAPFIEKSSEKVRAAAIRLAGAWKMPSATPMLLNIAEASNSFPTLRQAAFDGLREIGGKEVTAGLRKMASPPRDEQTRRMAAIALAGIDLNGSLSQVVEAAKLPKTEQEGLDFWRALLGQKGAAPVLARGVAKATLPEISARAGLRVAREGGRNEPDLILAIARAGGLSDEGQNLTDEELHRIAYNVPKGDAARGEKVYRRKELACITCHAIGGAGGKVGPDMTSLGASAVVDYIVESVIAPNKKVKEGYHSIQVTTKEGQEMSGVPVRENNEELVLRDTANKEISVPKKNIENRKISGSLMPAGLADILTDSERLDLFRFLSELGKPGPFDGSKGNVARVWRINASKGVASDPNAFSGEVTNVAWTPVYGTVSGSLLKQDILSEAGSAQREDPVLAAARFQSSKAGNVKLKLEGLNSPKAWLDGRPVSGSTEISADLAAGVHTLVLKIDPRQLPDAIRLESSDVSFLVD